MSEPSQKALRLSHRAIKGFNGLQLTLLVRKGFSLGLGGLPNTRPTLHARQVGYTAVYHVNSEPREEDTVCHSGPRRVAFRKKKHVQAGEGRLCSVSRVRPALPPTGGRGWLL